MAKWLWYFLFFELHFTADANCERDTRDCFAFDSLCIYRHELRARCVCVILAKFQLIGRLTGTGEWNSLKVCLIACYCELVSLARQRERALCIKLFLACATLFDLGRLSRTNVERCQYFYLSFLLSVYRALRSLPLNYKCARCLIAEAEQAGSAEPARLVADRLTLCPPLCPCSLSLSLSCTLSGGSVSILAINKQNKK